MVAQLDEARDMAMAAVQAIADRNAAKVLPIIQAIKKSGATSLHQIADALNTRGVSTPRRGIRAFSSSPIAAWLPPCRP